NEFTLLQEVPVDEIEKKAGIVMAEAIKRMRTQQVNPQGGYDGEYGVIKIFKEGEIAALTGQMNFFGMAGEIHLTCECGYFSFFENSRTHRSDEFLWDGRSK